MQHTLRGDGDVVDITLDRSPPVLMLGVELTCVSRVHTES
jgi:hypothetical protein